MFIDYYKIIQVHPECDREILNRMRKHYALLYHPDRAPADKKSEFTKTLQMINSILDILLDPEKRDVYDSTHPYFQRCRNSVAASSEKNQKAEQHSRGKDYMYAGNYPMEIRKYLNAEILFKAAKTAKKQGLFDSFDRKQFYNFANRIRKNQEFTSWQAKNIANYIKAGIAVGII
jgi:curved DNA-binding protein CbpA